MVIKQPFITCFSGGKFLAVILFSFLFSLTLSSKTEAESESEAECESESEPGSSPEFECESEPESARPFDPDGPRPYELAGLVVGGSDREMASAALDSEAPIVFDRLARTLAGAWGVGRVTDRFRDRVRAALPVAALDDDGVLWTDVAQRDSFRGFRVPSSEQEERSAEELPSVEVVAAMAWVLRQHHALARDDLARETARCFGIQRLGSVVRQVTDLALADLIANGSCRLDGQTVRLIS